MPSDKLKSPPLPLEFYSETLLVIKGVKFTPRQIDIIACLISGGTGKTISSLLSIEIKTIEAHKKDIAGRIGGGVQEDIISFVQSSHQYENIKLHYVRLLDKAEFEKALKELKKQNKETSFYCRIVLKPVSHDKHKNYSSFIFLFSHHLKLAGIEVLEERAQQEHKSENDQVAIKTIYFIDKKLVGYLKRRWLSLSKFQVLKENSF